MALTSTLKKKKTGTEKILVHPQSYVRSTASWKKWQQEMALTLMTIRTYPEHVLMAGKLHQEILNSSVPARNFCLRAKVAPTTHFWGPDISRKGQCTSIFPICKREETVGKLMKWKWQFIWSWQGVSVSIHKYTTDEIFGNKANSTIRMYAIKIVSNFFHLIFHFTVKIYFLSLLLNCFASIHFFVTFWEKSW